MEADNNKSAVKRFVKNIVAIDMGLLIVDCILTFALNFNFGITLFLLGVLVGGVGAFLGGADPTDLSNPRNSPSRSSIFRKEPVQDALDQISYNTEHSVSRYAFENALMYAGLMAFLVSIPFLISIMF